MELSDIEWAIEFIDVTSARMVTSGQAKIGQEDTRHSRIMDKLRGFIKAHPDGVKRKDVTRKMNNDCTSAELDRFIASLEQGHEIGKRVHTAKNGNVTVVYFPV